MSKPFEVFTNLFGRLKEHKVSIHNAVDVGCYKGEWSKRLKKIYPTVNLYLIDASDIYAKELNELGTFISAYVGQNEEERNFYHSDQSETGNSLYLENSNIKFNFKKIKTKKLIDIIPFQNYDYIKMDVQGAELEIIEGSLPLFTKTKWVQLECPVHPNNKGAPNFAQIINYMANSGFETFDIENIFYNGKLMCIDFLFNNITLPKVTSLELETLEYKIN
jgi:FkbM family methyltransferase